MTLDIIAGTDVAEYLTAANVRSVFLGAGSGVLVVGLLALLGRPPGWLIGCLAPLVAFFVADRMLWRDPSAEWLLAVVVVGVLGGRGYERLRRDGPVASLLLVVCAGGVWLAVPENGPVLVVVGVVVGLVVVNSARAPGVGWGLSMAVAWSVLLGARTWGWSFVGGLTCLAPLAAVGFRASLPGPRGWLPSWPWLVAAGGAVSFAAARWVGVAPDASWTRVWLVLAGAGAAVVVWRR